MLKPLISWKPRSSILFLTVFKMLYSDCSQRVVIHTSRPATRLRYHYLIGLAITYHTIGKYRFFFHFFLFHSLCIRFLRVLIRIITSLNPTIGIDDVSSRWQCSLLLVVVVIWCCSLVNDGCTMRLLGVPRKTLIHITFLSLSLPFSDFFFFQLSSSTQWNMNFDLISMKHALHWKFISNYPNLQRIDSFLADLYGFCIIRFRFNFPIKTISKCRLHEKLTRSKNHLTA